MVLNFFLKRCMISYSLPFLLAKCVLDPPGFEVGLQYWCHMRNLDRDPCGVWTHDPEVAMQTPYPLCPIVNRIGNLPQCSDYVSRLNVNFLYIFIGVFIINLLKLLVHMLVILVLIKFINLHVEMFKITLL